MSECALCLFVCLSASISEGICDSSGRQFIINHILRILHYPIQFSMHAVICMKIGCKTQFFSSFCSTQHYLVFAQIFVVRIGLVGKREHSNLAKWSYFITVNFIFIFFTAATFQWQSILHTLRNQGAHTMCSWMSQDWLWYMWQGPYNFNRCQQTALNCKNGRLNQCSIWTIQHILKWNNFYMLKQGIFCCTDSNIFATAKEIRILCWFAL